MTTPSFLSVDIPNDLALHITKQKLAQMGLHALQTFDLHSARHAQHECPCPNHGMEDCDCQMVILLVYGETAEPATLILHGNDGKTWFSIADDPSHSVDRKLIGSIRQALECKAPLSF